MNILSYFTRLNHFEDNWINLEKWFIQYANLELVNASEDPQIVYDTVESIIEKKIKMVPSRFLADYEYNNNCFEATIIIC